MWTQKRFGKEKGIVGIEQTSDFKNNSSLIVTLSGLGQSMSEKNFLYSTLRKRLLDHWVIQFDYHGHGDSQGYLEDCTIESMIEDTLEVLQDAIEKRIPNTIYLVGNGLGSVIALEAAYRFEMEINVTCIPILISPPKHDSVVISEICEKLNNHSPQDTKKLIPGNDYYFLSDFNKKQLSYIQTLGSHIQYLHGQKMSKELANEIKNLSIPSLISKCKHFPHLICGELDQINQEYIEENKDINLYKLENVTYFYEHPAAMDKVIEIIRQITNNEGQGRRLEKFEL